MGEWKAQVVTALRDQRVLIGLCAVVGMGWLAASTHPLGLGLTSDSVLYLAVAHKARQGLGLVDYLGAPLVVQPPLYPLLLAVVAAVPGLDPVAGARWLNVGLFGLIICLAGLLLRRLLAGAPALAGLGTLAVLCAVPMSHVLTMAWSEPLFIALTLAALLAAAHYQQKGHRRQLVLWAGATALAWLTRYIGVTLVITALVLLADARGQGWRARLGAMFTFGTIATTPMALWLARNALLAGSLTGERPPSEFSLGANITLTLEALTPWFLPTRLQGWPAPWLLGGACLLGLIGVCWAGLAPTRTSWGGGCQRSERASAPLALTGEAPPHVADWRPALLFTAVYVAFLLLSSTLIAFDPIDSRLLAPIFIPLLCVALVGVQRGLAQIQVPWQVVAGRIVVVALLVWLVYPLRKSLRTMQAMQLWGYGYNSNEWRANEVVGYLQSHPLSPARPVWSNDTRGLYISLGLAAQPFPPLHQSGQAAQPEALAWLPGAGDPFYLVWFYQPPTRAAGLALAALRTHAHLVPVVELEEGAVYIVTPHGPR